MIPQYGNRNRGRGRRRGHSNYGGSSRRGGYRSRYQEDGGSGYGNPYMPPYRSRGTSRRGRNENFPAPQGYRGRGGFRGNRKRQATDRSRYNEGRPNKRKYEPRQGKFRSAEPQNVSFKLKRIVLSSGDPSLHETDDNNNRQHNLLQSSFYDMFLLARVDSYEKSIQINAKRVEGNLFTTKIMPSQVHSVNVFTDTLPGETFFEKFEEQLTLEKQLADSKVEEEQKEKALSDLKEKLEALDGDESEVEKKKLELEVKQAELDALELSEKFRKVRERLEQLRTELFEVEEPDLEENVDDEEMQEEPLEPVVETDLTQKPEDDKPESDEPVVEEVATENATEEGEPVVEEKDGDGEEKATEEEEKEDAPVEAEETPEDPPAAPETVDIIVVEEGQPQEDAPEGEEAPEETTPEEIPEEAATQEELPEDVEMEDTEEPVIEVEAEAEKDQMEAEEETPKDGEDEAVIDLTEDVEDADPEKNLCRILIGLKEPLTKVRTSLQGCRDAAPKTFVILLEADLPEGNRFMKVKKFLENFMKGSYQEDQINKIKWGKKVKTANVAAKLLKEAMKRRRIDFEMVTCPNDCGVTLKAYEMLDHEKRECKNRQVECRYCKVAMKHCEMAEHKTVCQLCILRCVNNCGKSIARKDMECHLATTCLNQKIECEFASFGCKQKEKRKNKVHHLNQRSVQHLNLVRKAHEKLQNKYNKLLDFLKEKFDDVPEFEEPESEEPLEEDKKPVENEPQCIVIED